VRVIGVARRSIFVAASGCLAMGCHPPVVFINDDGVARYSGDATRFADFAIRVRSNPAQLALTLRRGDWLDSPHAYFGVYPWNTGLGYLRASRHFMARLFTAFALFGLALAMIGIYGVTAHSVARRTPEFGIRMALGATPGEILRLVLREGNAIALAGIALGLLLAKWGMQLIDAFLYGVDRAVPVLFAVAIVGIFAAVILASLVPAVRATRASPMDALRTE
jgi:ABC-type antimicrobial peptide transport system permease subunit